MLLLVGLLYLVSIISALPVPQNPFYDNVVVPRRIRYEAEEAHLIGSTLNRESFIDINGSLIFSVNIPLDDTYDFTLVYKSLADSVISVSTNGYTGKSSMLSASNNGWVNQTLSLNFRQGLNTVLLKTEPFLLSSPVSIDYFEIDGAIPLSLTGATLPYVEFEAENATFNGVIIGPSRDLYKVPTEASQRLAVQINQNQYVEFTLTAPANAITVRFSIPDTANGVGQVAYLNVVVDGKDALNLTVTSKFSWAYGEYPFTKNPSDGKPHHFYDEARGLFGKTINTGSKVRIVADNPITYTIDLADFYMVPDPYPMPSGFISITDNGADPDGNKDSTAAFLATFTAASQQNKGVWIPKGNFLVNQRFTINKVTVRGAGPWYSTVRATVLHGVGFFGNAAPNPSVDVQLYDFAIVGYTNIRVDDAADSGVGGAFNGNSIVQNVWIEHCKCGMWLDGPFNGLHITGTIIRNTYADGINLHSGVTNVVIEQTILRNVADDALAIWSEKQADSNNVFKFNTIQVPILANGIAFYGGSDNSATDNYVADTICDGGCLQVGARYQSVPVAGTITFARNTLVRGGAPSRFGPQDCGAIWVWQEQEAFQAKVYFNDTVAIDSNFAAMTWWSGGYTTVYVSNMTVIGGPYVMEVNSASGNVPCDHVVAKGLTLPYGGIHSCAGLIFNDDGGNAGWDLNHDHQHCN